MTDNPPAATAPTTSELARVFLRLGLTAFGGPAAHIAMMRREFVTQRSWLTDAEFADLIGAASLIPGPSSTEVAIYAGRRLAGTPGLFLAGACFILPAALMVGAIAVAYTRYGALPAAAALLYGVKPVVVAIVVQAVAGLLRSVVRGWREGSAAAASAVASFLGAPPLAVVAAAGLLLGLERWLRSRCRADVRPLAVIVGAITAIAGGASLLARAAGPMRRTPAMVFLYFLKLGSVLYGSGYVLLAYLDGDLVRRYHWLTRASLLDAVAIGQFTPGPVFTTATFIGWLTSGTWGAVLATAGIFLPSFVFVALSHRLLARLRGSDVASAFMDGVNAASLALMAVVAVQLAFAAIVDAWTGGLALVSAGVLLRWRVNAAWLIAGGAATGWLLHAAHLVR